MTLLSVNLNKIALIRNSREGNYPDLAHFAKLCLDSGANGLTVHPRPDQRHIRANDCAMLKKICIEQDREFNIEGNPMSPACASQHPDAGDYPGFMPLVLEIKPHQCTLVPDSNEQLTSDHGFDLKQKPVRDSIAPLIEQLKRQGIRVSLFMNADSEQMPLAADIGADRVEFYTGPYAARPSDEELDKLKTAANKALECGLALNAGHDLNLENIAALKKAIPQLAEVSIGHALTVDGLLMGYKNAVKAYLKQLQ